MNDSSKIALAILAGAILVSGTLVWLGYSIRAASTQAPRVAVGPAAVPLGPAPVAMPGPLPPAANEASVLRVSDFVELWVRGGYQARAEKDCFKPLEQAKKPVTPTLDYALEIDPSGKVVKAEPRATRDELFELYGCVGKVIRSMSFAPTGARRTGEGQASRENAFLVVEPAPAASRR